MAGPADDLDWDAIADAIERDGYALTSPLLSPGECAGLIAGYADDSLFRRRIAMERHAFGVGSYAYFADPLPPLVASLRAGLYAGLSPIANRAMANMRSMYQR